MSDDSPPPVDPWPPPLPPRRLAETPPRAGWVAGAWTMAALAAVAVLGILGANLSRAELPPRMVSGPDLSASPQPSSAATTMLKQNPLYGLAVSADCPAQRPPGTAAAFRKQVTRLVNCQNRAWEPALTSIGVTFRPPVAKYYRARLNSPCGTLGTNFPASYCTANRTLYFSSAAAAQGRYYRLAVAEFVIHEYAHHVQTLTGIFTNAEEFVGSEAGINRRIELQAHCMAHYGLTHSGFGFSSADRAEAEYQFGFAADPKGHGSVTAERYWGRRGLAGDTVGACNTWTAKAKTVT